jgi:hypothetical protein
MPDFAPLLVALLSLAATVTLGIALFGRRDLSSPRCDRCNADLRDAAMSGATECACGTPFARRHAAQFPYRLRRRLAVVGLAFALAALALGMVEARVLSIGLGWRAVQPNWYFNAAWPYGADDVFDGEVLLRRVDALTSRDEARALLDALLSKPVTPGRGGYRVSLALGRLVALAALDKAQAARYARAVVDGAGLEFEDGEIRLGVASSVVGFATNSVIVRIDAVEADGVPVPFERGGEEIGSSSSNWRLQGMLARTVALVDDLDPVAQGVRVRGEFAILPLDSLAARLPEDPRLASSDDPGAWGVDIARTNFDIQVGSAATGPSAAALTQAPGEQLLQLLRDAANSAALRPFAAEPTGRAEPMIVAAAQPLACAAVGAGLGVAALLGLLALRALVVSSWRLDVAACGGCRSSLRGEGRSVPAVCPECGRPTSARDLRYGTRVVRPGLAVALAVPVALGLAALAWLAAPPSASRAAGWLRETLRTPRAVAGWFADHLLAGERRSLGGSDDIDAIWAPLPISPWTDEERQQCAAIMVDRVASKWRSAFERRTRAGSPPNADELLAWMTAVAGGCRRAADPVRAAELHAELEAMAETFGIPALTLPRCVRFGEWIMPQLPQRMRYATHYVQCRTLGGDEFVRRWTPMREFHMTSGVAPEHLLCSVDWRFAGRDRASWLLGLPSSALEGLSETIPAHGALFGTADRVVRVFVRDGPVTVVTDPELNPLDGEAAVTLEIRETGERDLVSIEADDGVVGVALAGSWRLGNDTGNPAQMVLRRELPLHQAGPWVGLASIADWTGDADAGAIDARPDELVATFVPDPDPGPVAVPEIGVTIVWGAETTVRFRRVPGSPLDPVARYELRPKD